MCVTLSAIERENHSDGIKTAFGAPESPAQDANYGQDTSSYAKAGNEFTKFDPSVKRLGQPILLAQAMGDPEEAEPPSLESKIDDVTKEIQEKIERANASEGDRMQRFKEIALLYVKLSNSEKAMEFFVKAYEEAGNEKNPIWRTRHRSDIAMEAAKAGLNSWAKDKFTSLLNETSTLDDKKERPISSAYVACFMAKAGMVEETVKTFDSIGIPDDFDVLATIIDLADEAYLKDKTIELVDAAMKMTKTMEDTMKLVKSLCRFNLADVALPYLETLFRSDAVCDEKIFDQLTYCSDKDAPHYGLTVAVADIALDKLKEPTCLASEIRSDMMIRYVNWLRYNFEKDDRQKLLPRVIEVAKTCSDANSIEPLSLAASQMAIDGMQDDAVKVFLHTVSIIDEPEYRFRYGQIDGDIGVICAELAESNLGKRAVPIFEELIRIAGQEPDKEVKFNIYISMAEAEGKLGFKAEARRFASKAVALAGHLKPESLCSVASALFRAGMKEDAFAKYDMAIDAAMSEKSQHVGAEILLAVAVREKTLLAVANEILTTAHIVEGANLLARIIGYAKAIGWGKLSFLKELSYNFYPGCHSCPEPEGEDLAKLQFLFKKVYKVITYDGMDLSWNLSSLLEIAQKFAWHHLQKEPSAIFLRVTRHLLATGESHNKKMEALFECGSQQLNAALWDSDLQDGGAVLFQPLLKLAKRLDEKTDAINSLVKVMTNVKDKAFLKQKKGIYAELIAMAIKVEDSMEQANVLENIGEAQIDDGLVKEGTDTLSMAVLPAKNIVDDHERAKKLAWLAYLLFKSGSYDRGGQVMQLASTAAKQIEDKAKREDVEGSIQYYLKDFIKPESDKKSDPVPSSPPS